MSLMLTVPAVVCPAATPFSGPITTPPFSFVNTRLLSIYTWGEADSPSQFQGVGLLTKASMRCFISLP